MALIIPGAGRPVSKEHPLIVEVKQHQDHIVIKFSRPIQELPMSPQGALELAQALVNIGKHLLKKGQAQ